MNQSQSTLGEVTEVVNDTEIYREVVCFTGMQEVELPGYVLWGELAGLLLVVVFGLALYVRRRQPCVLLLPLAALLFVVSILPFLPGYVPAFRDSALLQQVVLALHDKHWLRPVGTLLLAVYAVMQWRAASKR